MIIFEWFKSRVICYLSQQLVTEWVQSAVSEKSEGQVRAVMEQRIELCRFIRRFIRSNVDSCQTIQSMISKQQDQSVLWGWSLLWKWHRASEGHQQRNHYANSPPLCLTSNNTALYICKAWQDTLHTALLSEPGHARTATPVSERGYWARLHAGLRQTRTRPTELPRVARVTFQGSNVAGRWDRSSLLRNPTELEWFHFWSRSRPAEVKSTWLARWNLLSSRSVRPPLKSWR